MALERLYGCTTEQYFELPCASNSGVKEAHKMLRTGTLEDYEQHRPAYYFGSIIDAILTDPENVHTIDLPADQRKEVLSMCRAIERDVQYQALFSPEAGGERQAVFVNMEFPFNLDGLEVKIPVKCKFDWFNPRPKINFGADLKTTLARSEAAFKSASNWFDYPQQAAWYMDISDTDRFMFMGISKYDNAIYKIPIKRGDELYKIGKEKYLRCLSSWCKLNPDKMV